MLLITMPHKYFLKHLRMFVKGLWWTIWDPSAKGTHKHPALVAEALQCECVERTLKSTHTDSTG